MSNRQTGRTTQQMKDAPVGSVYVWCNSATSYPKTLAHDLGRKDLQVKPLSWLAPQNVYGHTFATVVIDHAARFDALAYDAMRWPMTRCATCDHMERWWLVNAGNEGREASRSI